MSSPRKRRALKAELRRRRARGSTSTPDAPVAAAEEEAPAEEAPAEESVMDKVAETLKSAVKPKKRATKKKKTTKSSDASE